jgi:hypothetical protein
MPRLWVCSSMDQVRFREHDGGEMQGWRLNERSIYMCLGSQFKSNVWITFTSRRLDHTNTKYPLFQQLIPAGGCRWQLTVMVGRLLHFKALNFKAQTPRALSAIFAHDTRDLGSLI